MNKLRSVLKKRRAKEDPRVRRRLFSWRMFAIILLVVSVLSIGNVLMLGKAAGNGSDSAWWRAWASAHTGRQQVTLLVAIIPHLYSCNKVDKPMRTLSRAMSGRWTAIFPFAPRLFHLKTSSIT